MTLQHTQQVQQIDAAVVLRMLQAATTAMILRLSRDIWMVKLSQAAVGQTQEPHSCPPATKIYQYICQLKVPV